MFSASDQSIEWKVSFPCKSRKSTDAFIETQKDKERGQHGAVLCVMLLSVLGALAHSIEVEHNLTKQQIKMACVKFERVFRKRQIM